MVPQGPGAGCYGLSMKCTSHVHAFALVALVGSASQQISHGIFGT